MLARAGDDPLHRLLYFRVRQITQVTIAGSQVVWTDEHAVDAVYGTDFVNGRDSLAALDLDGHRDVVIDDLEVIGDRHVTIAALRHGNATYAWRIACRRYGAARVVDRFHEG
jgi:hypothetical protein